MRKLAWFLIIVFFVCFALALASLVNEPFKNQLSDALAYAGGATYAAVSTQWMNLANLVSENGTYFLVYTFSVLLLGGIVWLFIRKLWERRPHLRTPSLSTSTPAITGQVSTVGSSPAGTSTRPTQTVTVTNPQPTSTTVPPPEPEKETAKA